MQINLKKLKIECETCFQWWQSMTTIKKKLSRHHQKDVWKSVFYLFVSDSVVKIWLEIDAQKYLMLFKIDDQK